MSAAIDHLGAHKLVKVLCRFEDAAGTVFEAGETGRIRHIQYDSLTMVSTIELMQGEELRKIVLPSPLSKGSGPKPGNLKQYFEVTGMEVVWEAGDGPKASFFHPDDPELAEVAQPEQSPLAEWNEDISKLDLKDRMEEAERRIKDRIPNPTFAVPGHF